MDKVKPEQANPVRAGVRIQRVMLMNFRKFETLDIEIGELCVLVGDNESGKSTVLLAIDLALGGSTTKVMSYGLESLFNKASISRFETSQKRIEDLPTMHVEIYLTNVKDPKLNGKNNSCGTELDGIRMECKPQRDHEPEIAAMLKEPEAGVPFEYYEVRFHTFADQAYGYFGRPVRHVFIESAGMQTESAIRDYVRDMYDSAATDTMRCQHQRLYREKRKAFCAEVLGDINSAERVEKFALRSGGRVSLDRDLTIESGAVSIEHRGKGIQSRLKISMALRRAAKSGREIGVVLLEEPENHLSHVNMREMVDEIRRTNGHQIVVATHNSLIVSRLDLRKCVLMNKPKASAGSLADVNKETAEFFMKAPSQGLLEFVLSPRVMLVEGAAEFMLMDAFFEKETGATAASNGVHVISVNGLSFQRYVEIARLLGIRAAVVRDNDGDYDKNCNEPFADVPNCVKVFAEKDGNLSTFEKCVYACNKDLCDRLFGTERRTRTVEDYMLAEKSEAAYSLATKGYGELTTPQYLKEAVQWVVA